MLGISTQQVQKYEAGKNRISASTLYALSKALGISVSCFFDEPNDSVWETDVPEVDFALSAAFARIKSRKRRQVLLAFIESMSKWDKGKR